MQKSRWDGWCALAPYTRLSSEALIYTDQGHWTARLTWQPKRVGPSIGGGRGKRSRSGAPRSVSNPEGEPCTFFQQRVRRGPEAYRAWLSDSVTEYMEEHRCIPGAGILELVGLLLPGF